MGKKPFVFDIFFGSFAAFLLIANGAEVTKSVVGEAKEMAKLAWNAVDDAAKLENSAKEILSEAKAVGKNSNTVVQKLQRWLKQQRQLRMILENSSSTGHSYSTVSLKRTQATNSLYFLFNFLSVYHVP